MVVGDRIFRESGKFAFEIMSSHRNHGDCMFMGVTDAATTARHVVYSPRAGEVYLFEEGALARTIRGLPSLLWKAQSSVITIRLAEGTLSFGVKSADKEEEQIVDVGIRCSPHGWRPFAKMGHPGVVRLRA